MFHDGTYWENEAAATFVAMGDGYGKMDRKIGWMPIPHPTTEGAGGSVFIGGASTMMFMNANIKEKDKDIATKFVQFMNTRKSLVEFTQITSMIRPLDFTATESEKQEMSYFGRSIYEKFKSADNFNPMSDNSVYKRNYSSFSIISSNNWRTLSSALGNTDIPSNALKSTDAKTYFRGMQAHFTQQWWNSSVLGN